MDGEFNAINTNNVKPHVREIGYSKSEKDNIVNSSRHFTSLVFILLLSLLWKLNLSNNKTAIHEISTLYKGSQFTNVHKLERLSSDGYMYTYT